MMTLELSRAKLFAILEDHQENIGGDPGFEDHWGCSCGWELPTHVFHRTKRKFPCGPRLNIDLARQAWRLHLADVLTTADCWEVTE